MSAHLEESALFSAYNAAKAWARRTGLTDEGRVDRALGIIKSGMLADKVMQYMTSKDSCRCPDRRFTFCKHQLALMIQFKADEIMLDFKLEAPEGPEVYRMATSHPAYKGIK